MVDGSGADAALLLDMLLAARDALRFTAGRDEAERKVSASTPAEYQGVAWRQMIGVRNRLIHGCADVEPVRLVARDHLESLITILSDLIPDEDDAE
jgi:uncharacterized protein with HEPN domain